MNKSASNTVEMNASWLESPLGRYLLAKEQPLFNNALQNIFGFNALQIGFNNVDLLENCRMPHKFQISDFAESPNSHITAVSHQLPILANSIDLVLLPHTLDFSEDPHHTLTEAERVLVGEGYVVIAGFNPISSWGLKRLISRKSHIPWNAHFLPFLRLKDWLILLDFEITELRMTCYNLPINSENWLHRFTSKNVLKARSWPLMGGVYFVVAKKRVPSMRLIKPSWKSPKLVQQLASTPSQSRPSQHTSIQNTANQLITKSEE